MADCLHSALATADGTMTSGARSRSDNALAGAGETVEFALGLTLRRTAHRVAATLNERHEGMSEGFGCIARAIRVHVNSLTTSVDLRCDSRAREDDLQRFVASRSSVTLEIRSRVFPPRLLRGQPCNV
jgi:hypothetical protein